MENIVNIRRVKDFQNWQNLEMCKDKEQIKEKIPEIIREEKKGLSNSNILVALIFFIGISINFVVYLLGKAEIGLFEPFNMDIVTEIVIWVLEVGLLVLLIYAILKKYKAKKEIDKLLNEDVEYLECTIAERVVNKVYGKEILKLKTEYEVAQEWETKKIYLCGNEEELEKDSITVLKAGKNLYFLSVIKKNDMPIEKNEKVGISIDKKEENDSEARVIYDISEFTDWRKAYSDEIKEIIEKYELDAYVLFFWFFIAVLVIAQVKLSFFVSPLICFLVDRMFEFIDLGVIISAIAGLLPTFAIIGLSVYKQVKRKKIGKLIKEVKNRNIEVIKLEIYDKDVKEIYVKTDKGGYIESECYVKYRSENEKLDKWIKIEIPENSIDKRNFYCIKFLSFPERGSEIIMTDKK